jgi:hypothetical protein
MDLKVFEALNLGLCAKQRHLGFQDPKTIPLVICQIGIGARITMIKNALHASEAFTTLVGILVDTLAIEKSKPEPGLLLIKSIAKHCRTC